MKKSIFRRWWFWVIVAVVAIGAAASQNNGPTKESGNAQSPSGPSPNAPQPTEELTFSLAETAVFKNLKVTAQEIKQSTGNDFLKPGDGKHFVGVEFLVENTSDEDESLSSLLMFDPYADDVKCAYSFSANVVFGEGTLDGNLSAGKKMVGWYAVEIPNGTRTLELEVKDSWLSSSKARFVFSLSGPEVPPEISETTTSLGISYERNGLTLTLDSVEQYKGNPLYPLEVPEGGNMFIVLRFTINNAWNDDYIFGLTGFDAYCDGYSASPQAAVFGAGGLPMLSTTVAAGKSAERYVAYQVDADWAAFEFHYTPTFIQEDTSPRVIEAEKMVFTVTRDDLS